MEKAVHILRSYKGLFDSGDINFLDFADTAIVRTNKRIREFVRFSMGKYSKMNARIIEGSKKEKYFAIAMPDQYISGRTQVLYISDAKAVTSVYGLLMRKTHDGDIFAEHQHFNGNRKTIRVSGTQVFKAKDLEHVEGGNIEKMIYAAKRSQRSLVNAKVIAIVLNFVFWQTKLWHKFTEDDESITYFHKKTISHVYYVKFMKKMQIINGKEAFIAHVSKPRGRNADFTIYYFHKEEQFLIPNIS